MLVDGGVKSLMQGVSQQPARDRLPGQCTLQQNMRADPIEGLSRRGSSELIDKLFSSSELIGGWHEFSTKTQENFMAAFIGEDIKVFDLNGTEKSVVYDVGKGYTHGAGIRCYTDGNVTYITNPNVVVEMAAETPDYFNVGTNRQEYAAIIQILGGMYGKTYTVTVDGSVVASQVTADGSLPAHSLEIGTAVIADKIAALLTVSLPNPNWGVFRKEDIILVTHNAPFNLVINDDWGNVNARACGETVGSTSELPKYAPHLYAIRLAERADPEMDVWFKFVVEGQETNTIPTSTLFGSKGYWQECPAPDTPTTLQEYTMPHSLTYNEDTDTFHYGRPNWEARKAGTIKSNPNPSFVGDRVNDINGFQSRLVFVSGGGECMSRTNRPLDFWFASVAQQVDTDPIDMKSRANSSILRALVQHNKDLVAFATKGQFVTFGRSNITPTNGALVLSSEYESSLLAKPVSSGRNVFFATKFGKYSGIREFYAEGQTDANDSRDVTKHVRKYIEGDVTAMTCSPNYDTLMVHTNVRPWVVYMYQYLWEGEERLQQSWSELVFTQPVVWSFFIEDIFFLVYKVDNDYYLAKMSLDVQPSAGIDYHAHLDLQFDVPGVNTQFILPYGLFVNDFFRCVQGAGCPTPGLVAPIESIVYDSDNDQFVVTLKNDMQGGNVIAGTRFQSSYWPTMPMVKDEDSIKVGTGSLKVSKFLVSVARTGEMIGQAVSKYGNGPIVKFTARILGDILNKVGVQPIIDTTYVMPFGHNSDLAEVHFSTDSHLPLNILDIEWVGSYNKRGRRIRQGD